MRDDKGRFIKGHGKTGGRQKRAVEESYLELFKNAVSEPDWLAIIQRAVADAKRGDSVARKFIADYLIGAPVQRVGGADGENLEILVTVNGQKD